MKSVHNNPVLTILGSLFALWVNQPALAQQTPQTERDDVFNLGEIVVTGKRTDFSAGIGGATIDREALWTFEKNSLDQAVNLVPGVNGTLDANGRRNESDIFVRGFGRWQVPLLIDGVRVYLPADNRLDFGRFLTFDIAEVQIRKGYASVLDGPGAMGGVINLVTRKPVKEFEAEFRGGSSLGGDGQNQGWDAYAMAGTRQDMYYLQGSVSNSDRDFWRLSNDYQPTATSMEDGDERIGSDSRDWRVNLKAGYTPNDTDEYTINYTRQEGEKGAPLNIYNNPQVPPNSFWRWPWWNIQNVSLLTNTQVGNASYLKSRFYYNTFDNALDAFDDITYTTQSNNGRFRSFYEDHAWGGSIEAGTELIEHNTLKAAFHYRDDAHTEWNHNRPTHPTLSSVEPEQEQSQKTWSVALENTFHATDAIDWLTGISYDEYRITRAEEFSSTTQQIFENPRGGSDAFNWQTAAIWHYNDDRQLHASVSDRARFPTIFELYSTRFGTAVPNPDLGPEQATNFEIGWQENIGTATRLSTAVFYSDIRNLIQTVQLSPGTTQTQNVGDGESYGVEVEAATRLSEHFNIGANYTYIHREIVDTLQPDLRPTGVPAHKAFVYIGWRPIESLSITPSLEMASKRWSDISTTPAPAFPYVKTGSYVLANLQIEYQLLSNVEIAAGVKNLFDKYYELAWGLPQPGRSFSLRGTVSF